MTKAEAKKVIHLIDATGVVLYPSEWTELENALNSMATDTDPDPRLEVVQRIRNEMAYAVNPGGSVFGYHVQLQGVLDRIKQEAGDASQSDS